jgi:hypothetical protein
MIWYTYPCDENVLLNQFVQLSSDRSKVEIHSSGKPIGICLEIETNSDTGEKFAKVYSAGGSGNSAVLGANWDGSPMQFNVVSSKVVPVAENGIGWLLPVIPVSERIIDEIVNVAIYKI